MRGTRRWRWIIVMCRAACVLLASLASACSPSDEASPRPTPTSPTTANSANPAGQQRAPPDVGPRAGSERHSRSRSARRGRLPSRGSIQQSAVPLSGVRFLLACDENGQSGRVFRRVRSTTWPPGRICGAAPASSCGLGFVYSFHDGYEVDVQWVPTGASPAVQDLRLRPYAQHSCRRVDRRPVDSTSSLCTDLEDLWRMESRCDDCRHRVGGGHAACRGAPGGWRHRSIDLLVYVGQLCRLDHADRTWSRRNTGTRRDVSRPGGGSRRRAVAAIQRHDDIAVVIRQSANESVCALAGTRWVE